MKLGLQSSIYSNHDLMGEIQVALNNKAALGITFFDIFFDNWSPASIPPQTIEFIRNIKNNNLLEFTVHLPNNFYDYSYADKQIFYQFIVFLNPKTITIHYGKLDYEFIKELVNLASEANSVLSIENDIDNLNVIYGISYIEFLKEAKRQIGYMGKPQHLGATFDLGNAFLHGFDPIKSIESLIENGINISTIHIHDNDGKNYAHLPIGNGKIDFKSFLNRVKELNLDPYFVIEHWDNFPQSFNFIKNNF